MDLTDWFLLILTFITGLFVGAFIYVTSFAPVYAPSSTDGDEDAAMEFSVVGRAYGGMRADIVHASFRVLADGSFTYIPTRRVDEPGETFSGTLPRDLRNDLLDEAKEESLIQYAAPANKQCRVAVDGIDYEYRVVVDDVLYQLDTCSTALPYESDLNQVLEAIWSYLYDPAAYKGAPPRSLYDAAEDFLNDNLGVEPNE